MPFDTDGAPMCIETDFMDTYKVTHHISLTCSFQILGYFNLTVCTVSDCVCGFRSEFSASIHTYEYFALKIYIWHLFS